MATPDPIHNPVAVFRAPRCEPQPGRRSPRRGHWGESGVGGCPAGQEDFLTVASEFRYPSPYVSRRLPLRPSRARRSRNGGRSLRRAIALMHRIHDEFRFNPGATSITTPATRVLEERHGVCQDFAHLQMASLRNSSPAGAVCERVLPDQSAAGTAEARGRRRIARVAVGVVPRERIGRPRPHQRRPPRHEACDDCLGTRYRGREPPLHGVVLGGGYHELYVGVSVVPSS